MKFKEKGSGGGKDFLKLKAGETVRGVFRGEPVDFKKHWANSRSVACIGENCAYCKEDKKPSFRFRINFVISENGAYVSKIWEQGYTMYDTLRALNEEYPLEKHLMRITRNGTGQDTTYTVLPVANGLLKPEQEKSVAAIKLLNLLDVPSSEAVEAEEEENF